MIGCGREIVRQVAMAIGLCIVLGMAASGAHAQTQEEIDWCWNSRSQFSPDLSIAGCTAAIHLGRSSRIDLAQAFTNRGLAYHDKRDYDRAIADHSEATRLNPKLAAAFYNRGLAYHSKNDYDRAIADYGEAIRLNPKYIGAFKGRGGAYSAKKDYDRAIADYSEAIKIDSNDASAFNSRCWARALADRDLAQALDDCNEALRIRPDTGYILNSRGLVQFKLGAFDRAIADYGAAVQRDPKDADSLYGRGVAKLRSGDNPGGEADMVAARAIQADIAEVYAGYGVK